MAGVKIATCCYCGTRAALVLTGEKRHELACGQCGAPLHEMKLMPQKAAAPAKTQAAPMRPAAVARPAYTSHAPAYLHAPSKPKKKKKKSKPTGLRLAKKLWDIVDDIID